MNSNFWIRKNKKEKKQFIFSILIAVFFIVILSLLIFARDIFGDKIGDKILGEGNRNGFISIYKAMVDSSTRWLETLLTVSISFLIYFLLNVLIKATTLRGKKAQTIGSLISSCIKYLTILIAIGFILSIWGVDVSSIVAGLGILTLIIGLGCQSLISDIISGIFIVFDDYYSVGDYVIIDGFRGQIVSIGLKSTQICDYAGNLKSITNSQIYSCVNLSYKPSFASCSITINYEEDLEHVEAIIAKNLSSISDSLPKLTSPIEYKGVSNLSSSGVVLLFAAYCLEDDRYQIGRNMTRDIYLMLKKNGVNITYNEIVVNSPKEMNIHKASEEDKLASKKINSMNRKKAAPAPRKKTFIEKTKAAIEEEKSDLGIKKQD